jgi:hypothetical protein
MLAHLSSLPPDRPVDAVVAFGLDNFNQEEGERLTGASAPTRYATIGRAQELLRLSGTRVAQLRNRDPRFPTPAVEIHEQRLVRAGWREADVTAYKRGKEPAPAGEPEQYVGYSVIGELLGVTAERVRQLERKDPRFPPVAVELVGASTRRSSRQVIHKGWRREDVDVYVAARSSKQSAGDEEPSGSVASGRVP